ncbi:hypothetical protein RugamoR1_58330 [Rugamonas sp. R1(2021)]
MPFLEWCGAGRQAERSVHYRDTANIMLKRWMAGDVPTIALAVGYSRANTSPVLKLFLSRLFELAAS